MTKIAVIPFRDEPALGVEDGILAGIELGVAIGHDEHGAIWKRFARPRRGVGFGVDVHEADALTIRPVDHIVKHPVGFEPFRPGDPLGTGEKRPGDKDTGKDGAGGQQGGPHGSTSTVSSM